MPSSSRHARTASPPLTSTSYSNTLAAGQRLNVVTRLAIEGKSQRGSEGAAIRMYLKMSIPLDSITPGATLALFPEENLKILDSQVHPLDNNSVPYNFSSTTSPMLHRAARALNLPARSSSMYVPTPDSMSSSSASIPPLDNNYTGHILVSGYHVSYVLPREFPRREHESRSRRGASVMQFMASVDIWVPFLSSPPQAPYLLSIPVPRCLSNHIKLRIFPPNPSAASSMASISSADEEGGAWELTSDPHVTRNTARLSRSHSYNNFADDESSDASTSAGFAEGCGIQGTFPCTDRIRMRWATPVKPGQVPEAADGRRRVGIREVKGDMTCGILGNKGKGWDRGSSGVLMKLEYTAVCKGVWFPGVATLLGMDVGLEAEDCDVSWAPGYEQRWAINGSTGFTGYAIDGPPKPASRPSTSRQSSADYPPPSIYVLPSTPDGKLAVNGHTQASQGYASNSPSPSLLRAPLPVQNVADYSFESSPVTTPTGSVSSLTSLTGPSSPERTRKKRSSSINGRYPGSDTDVDAEVDVRPPRAPITVHLNMNELLPPPRNAFTFSISGVVVVTHRNTPLTPESRRSSPRSRPPADSEIDEEPVTLPRFRIFYADKESISTVVRNEADRTSVDIYDPVSARSGGKKLRAVLHKGKDARCGAEAIRVAVHAAQTGPPNSRRHDSSDDSLDFSLGRTRTSGGMRSVSSTSRLREMSMMSSAKLQPQRDGALMIPTVTANVTPLLGEGTGFQNGYAVHVCLPAPANTDSDWLEFGLALPGMGASISDSKELSMRRGVAADGPPNIDIASVSLEGVPVRFQTSTVAKPQTGNTTLTFEETSGKEWISWVRVHVGEIGGGKVELIYLVKGQQQEPPADEEVKGKLYKKDKQKAVDTIPMDILLPSFALPVGQLQVDIFIREGYEITSLRTNMVEQQSTARSRRLLGLSLSEFFYPRVRLCIAATPHPPSRQPRSYKTFSIGVLAATFLLLLGMVVMQRVDLQRSYTQLQVAKASAASYAAMLESNHSEPPETVTVTASTTTITASAHRWWLGTDSPVSNEPTTTPVETMGTPDPSTTTYATLSRAETAEMPTLTPSLLSPSNTPTNYAVMPPKDIVWSLGFNLPTIPIPHIDFSEAARTTVKTVVDGMGSLWQLFRKVVHYPLDPP